MLTGFLYGMLLPVCPLWHIHGSACLSPPLTAQRGEDCLCQHSTQAKMCPHTLATPLFFSHDLHFC